MYKTITLLGSSSGRNAGDAALIAGIMDSIDQACARALDYYIPTIKPSFVRDNYQNKVHPVSMLPWHASVKMLGWPTYKAIMNTDLTLVFDAILFDRDLYNPLFNYLSTLALLLPRAKRAGKPLGFFNVSAGPINTAAGRKMLAKVAGLMDFITVRDENSRNLLCELGVAEKSIVLTADAALTMRSASKARVLDIMQQLDLTPGQEILGINVSAYLDSWAGSKKKSLSKAEFLQSYSSFLNNVADKLGAALLFVSTQHHDEPLTRELMNLVTVPVKKALLSNVTYSPYDIRGVLAEISMLFGMRLHATILASAGLTPVLGLPHQPKVSHYFKTLGIDDCIITFDEYSVEALTQHVLKGWERKSKIKSQLEIEIPKSRERALQAAKIVAQMGAVVSKPA